MKKIFAFVFVSIAIFAIRSEARALDAPCGITDGTSRTLSTVSVPAKGQTYTDPIFGCKIKRLSDVAKEGGGYISHLYSSVSPFNSNSTYILVGRNDGIMQIRDLNGNIVRDNLHHHGILPTGDAVWSRKDPNVIYYHPVGGNTLRSYNVQTNTATTLYAFTGYTKVSFGIGEGDISWDGDHLAVIGDNKWGFIHTISAKTNTKAVDLVAAAGGVSLNNIDITPNNQFAMMYNPVGDIGFKLYDTSMNFKRVLTNYQAHSDRARDNDGSDLLVLTNSADKTPLPNCQNGIVKVNGETGVETCIFQPLSWSVAVHVSCNNVGQGWCLVSTYSGGGSWAPYKNELIMVKLDGSKATRLAHTRSSNGSYDAMSKAAVSPDGKYVVFASDMSGKIDTYLLMLGDGTVTPTPTPAPSPFIGTLIKTPCSPNTSENDPCRAVYYYGSDGKRHAFPNEKTYFTWYTHFGSVIVVPQEVLSSIPLGKNVTYRPGTKMVKFATSPKVYTVSSGGILRWVASESIASALYGYAWASNIDDISDALFADYAFGTTVSTAADYNPQTQMNAAVTINQTL